MTKLLVLPLLLAGVNLSSIYGQEITVGENSSAEFHFAAHENPTANAPSAPLRLEDLVYIRNVSFSLNRASVFQDKSNQLWFIKDNRGLGRTGHPYMLANYLASKILELLYPGHFAQSQLIAGNPNMIASKMIPGFLPLGKLRATPCDINKNTICNRLIRGHDILSGLIDFLGFDDYHDYNVGVVEIENDYLVTMVDYDGALLWPQDKHVVPLIPLKWINNTNQTETFAIKTTTVTAVFQKIVNEMTDARIRSLVSRAMNDLSSNGIAFATKKKDQICSQLIESRDRIRDKIEGQVTIQAVLNNDELIVKKMLEKRKLSTVFDYQGIALKAIVDEKGSDAMKRLIKDLQ